MLEITHGVSENLRDESEFEVSDFPEHLSSERDPSTFVRIHPWARDNERYGLDTSVYIVVGHKPEDMDSYHCAIVDRDEFVTGLLAVFPELKRNEDHRFE